MNTVNPTEEIRAKAIAEIVTMREELISAHDTIDQLQANLHREEDRCTMLIDEVNRWRNDALRQRAVNNRLATALANVGLLTIDAQQIIASGETDLPKTATAEAGLGAAATLGAEALGDPEFVQQVQPTSVLTDVQQVQQDVQPLESKDSQAA